MMFWGSSAAATRLLPLLTADIVRLRLRPDLRSRTSGVRPTITRWSGDGQTDRMPARAPLHCSVSRSPVSRSPALRSASRAGTEPPGRVRSTMPSSPRSTPFGREPAFVRCARTRSSPPPHALTPRRWRASATSLTSPRTESRWRAGCVTRTRPRAVGRWAKTSSGRHPGSAAGAPSTSGWHRRSTVRSC